MPITPTKKIWMDGELVDWDDATIHILNPTLHYGWGVFEGVRAYATDRGPAVFRLTEHINRLFRSAHLYLMQPSWTPQQLVEATKELVRVNEVDECYIRPLLYLGHGEMGLNPLPSKTVASIACWPWGAYLGADAAEKGCRVHISSWQRIGHNTIPPAGKAGEGGPRPLSRRERIGPKPIPPAGKAPGQFIHPPPAKVAPLKGGFGGGIMVAPDRRVP